MTSAFSTSDNRKMTLILLAICGLLAIAAAAEPSRWTAKVYKEFCYYQENRTGCISKVSGEWIAFYYERKTT